MASDQKRSIWPKVTIVVAVLCLIVALPDTWKRWSPDFFKPSLRLGLDLAGGTQLDFRISEDEIAAREEQLAQDVIDLKKADKSKEALAKEFELKNVQDQHMKLVEAIRAVLERRVNSLGVSEATITPSYFGNEKHLLVECPGIIDVNRCIATVGKTIQLEFKEEYNGSPVEYAAKIRKRADQVFTSLTTGTGNLQIYGQDLSSQLGTTYFDARPIFVSDLPKGLESLASRTVKDPVLKSDATLQATGQNAQGQTELREVKGIYLSKILENRKPAARTLSEPSLAYPELAKRSPGATVEEKSIVDLSTAPIALQPALQSMEIGSQKVVAIGTNDTGIVYLAGRTDGAEQMDVSHILIQYKGVFRADPGVTRTKEQALAIMQDIKKRLDGGGDFAKIAKTESDGPSKAGNGSIGTIKRGLMPESFEKAAFALKKGQISAIVETPFGFHIIRADSSPSTGGTKVTYTLLRVKAETAAAQKLLDQVQKGQVTRTEDQIVIRGLFFSLEPTGWQDTTLNGRRFRSAAVTMDPVTSIPVVQIQFDEEGGKIFQELTKRNIGKKIAIFVGGDLVSAPTVQNEIAGGNAVITGSRDLKEAQNLAQDLNTGAIPAPIYLSGQTTVEATLGTNALHQSIVAAAVGLLILCLFMIIVYRLLGVMATIALLFYVTLLMASMKLPVLLITKEHVVLTLAGIAGIILSMGMAVDANVLAFERIKEELRRGKMLRTAIDTGFRKAWPSVRDGNTSTLITCAILFTIGTSIIRGFAVTLSMGIFISLFTAIVVTRWLCHKLISPALAERLELFGVKKENVSHSVGQLPPQ